MLKDLYTYVHEGSIYYGLEICENLGNLKFNLLELRRKKQELFISEEESFSTLEDATGELKKNAPLFLIINTQQVLTKINQKLSSSADEALVNNAFPNLDFNSFYYELTASKENVLISICSKESVEVFLNKLQDLQVNVVDFALGVSPITAVTNFLNDGIISVSNTQIILRNDSIENIDSNQVKEGLEVSEYDVNGILVKNDYLLGLSSVLKYLMKTEEGVSNFKERTNNLRNEFKNKRYFTLGLNASIGLILGALIINFLFFNYYFDKVNGLQETLSVNNVNKNQLINLRQDVKKKEDRIQAILATSNSRSSTFIDEIVEKMPLSILLSELDYQPLVKPIRDGKQIEIKYNIIVLSGQSSKSKEYYTWVENLEKLAWVSQIETTDYDYESKKTSKFSLEIEIDEKRN